MIMTHRENIPFFNDIPTMAIPAVARLFDAVRTPGFSFPMAYSDFIGDLNRIKIDPPARPLVKRWMAGVQAGHIARPSLVEVDTDAIGVLAYFEALPEAALPALQAAWDRARDKRFSVRSMLELFSRDMSEIGCAAPSLTEMESWIKAVRSGLVLRTGPDGIAHEDASQIDPADEDTFAEDARAVFVDDLSSANPEGETAGSTKPILVHAKVGGCRPTSGLSEQFEKLTPATFGGTVFSTLMEASIMPPEAGDERPDPALALVARQMIEEEVARINRNVRASATATVAARLRQMAATLDPSDAL